MEQTAFNPKRRLCSDGSCVGVLGADGRCSVCHRSAGAGGESFDEGPDRAFGGAPDEAAGGAPDEAPFEASADGRPVAPAADGATSGFDPTRRLCDDGSCVGIVGTDGVCGVCGQRAG